MLGIGVIILLQNWLSNRKTRKMIDVFLEEEKMNTNNWISL